jgi:hypothetical protein
MNAICILSDFLDCPGIRISGDQQIAQDILSTQVKVGAGIVVRMDLAGVFSWCMDVANGGEAVWHRSQHLPEVFRGSYQYGRIEPANDASDIRVHVVIAGAGIQEWPGLSHQRPAALISGCRMDMLVEFWPGVK